MVSILYSVDVSITYYLSKNIIVAFYFLLATSLPLKPTPIEILELLLTLEAKKSGFKSCGQVT